MVFIPMVTWGSSYYLRNPQYMGDPTMQDISSIPGFPKLHVQLNAYFLWKKKKNKHTLLLSKMALKTHHLLLSMGVIYIGVFY